MNPPRSPAAGLFQQAFKAHQDGQLELADAGYGSVLRLDPRHFDALHMRGVLALQRGDATAAVRLIGQATQLHGGYAPAWLNLAAAHQQLGQPGPAADALAHHVALAGGDAPTLTVLVDLYRQTGRAQAALPHHQRLVALAPDRAEHWHALGLCQRSLRQEAAALDSFGRALSLQPKHPLAATDAAISLYLLGRHEQALERLDRLLQRRLAEPAAVHNARALVLWALGRPAEALTAFDSALAAHPGHAEAWANRGALMLGKGDAAQALQDVERALQSDPHLAEAHVVKGAALAALRRHADAIDCYRRAIQLQADFAKAHNNLGVALLDNGDARGAAESFARAIALAVNDPMTAADAHLNRIRLWAQARQFDRAAADARAALALNPALPLVTGDALYFQRMQADWADDQAQLAALLSDLQAGRAAATPFVTLTLSDDPGLLLQVARRHARSLTTQPAKDFVPPAPGPRIRLAWCSADFHDHATAHLLAGVLEHIDRSRFELIALSYGPATQDAYQQRLLRSFDRFLPVRELSDAAIAARLRELQVDVAIDLKGYTHEGRPGIFAGRNAPVQLSYLAFPGTLGLPQMDYLIADPVVVPPADDLHYSEALARLPDSYQPTDDRRAIAGRVPTRAEAGLPASGFVFCSFNNTYKITPAVFEVWMRLLQQVQGSVLWLLQDNPQAVANLGREAQARGIDSRRLVFAPRLPVDEHLARHALADLFLDTWPVNAHTTASDALWAGLPLITLPGRSFASRVAASLLQAAGLPDAVATDVPAYEALALSLARDPDRLAALRARVEQARTRSALFDTRRYTRHLEAALTHMHDRARAGLQPVSFQVERQTGDG